MAITKAVVAGADPEGLGEGLAERGVEVTYAEGTAARPALEEAGVLEADALVVTDVGLATSIPVAKDMNEDLRVVIYVQDTATEFARSQADLIVDPELMDPDTVAEELSRD
jgi:UDP:flavonoid glycosyltransferase YjiC (YdhE family)